MATALAPPPPTRPSSSRPSSSAPVDGPAPEPTDYLAPGEAEGDETCEEPLGCVALSPCGFVVEDDGYVGVDGKVRTRIRMPDGHPYPGDLLDDILEYRQLRTQQLAQSSEADEARLAELENRLRAIPNEGETAFIRAYHRFDVSIRAKLRHGIGEDVRLSDVVTVNVSAGGVKLKLDEIPPEGERVWLMLPRYDAIVVLPARVAWSRGEAVGLMFAGAPTTRPLKGKRPR